MFENKIPVKNKNLRIINYLNTYYGTIDGEHLYQVDPLVVGLLKYCDGKTSFNDILKKLSEKTGIEEEKIKPVLERIFKELTEMKFIEWK